MTLYSDLAGWWPLMSPPSQYVEEATDLLPLLVNSADETPPLTLLELGCGGGSLAYHLKIRFTLTLTDISPEMLAVSGRLNPEADHMCGDMTSLDLGRLFDRVLVHDAIMSATEPGAVRATLRTAARHLKSGGVVVVVPDCVRETFEPDTTTGGEDGDDGRGLRYLQWTWSPDPNGHTYEVAFAFLLRGADGEVTVRQDRHTFGCFPRADWLAWFQEAGLAPRIHVDPWKRDVFIGAKG